MNDDDSTKDDEDTTEASSPISVLFEVAAYMREETHVALLLSKKHEATEEQKANAAYLLTVTRLIDIAVYLGFFRDMNHDMRLKSWRKSTPQRDRFLSTPEVIQEVSEWARKFLARADIVSVISFQERSFVLDEAHRHILWCLRGIEEQDERGEEEEQMIRHMLHTIIAALRQKGAHFLPLPSPENTPDVFQTPVSHLLGLAKLSEAEQDKRAREILETALRLLGLTDKEIHASLRFLRMRARRAGGRVSVH